MQTRIPAHSQCDACGAAIHYGQAAVCLCRNTEQRDHVGTSSLDQITVMESVQVLALCPACSERLPARELTQLLRAELKRRLACRN